MRTDDIKVINNSVKNKYEIMVAKYYGGLTVLEAYQEGLIDDIQLRYIGNVMSVNGYSKVQLYDLPLKFALKLM